jgi:tRNA A-37 threonylcarbamoyl transferase component Bud32/tetratricopeptide (TPR) repeat protein
MSQPVTRLESALADRYRIERELGQGGMATVYLAEDLRHRRKVAVKVLKPELAAVLGVERFVQEITTTASLQHPNILPLFDSGSADGFLYYVMPYVEGETLRDRLHRERQLGVAESLEITAQVAAALASAHERGIVHRDIKPDNIMFSGGQAVVADFGIARAIDAAGGEQLTMTGMAIGTPAYMSPEQSAGESNVDGRSDLYSLASMLYEMLAGEPPFTGHTAAAIIAKRLGAPTPRVRVIRQTVPESVDRALQRALQRAPADRFDTVTAFARALRAEAAATPRRRPSRRVLLTVTGIAAALLLAAAGWWRLGAGRGAGDLNPDVIAVLPFRVGGPAIGYLRESMLDLLNARLAGETGPRTLEPRTTLSAWRRAGGSETEDLSEDASRRLAARLGAGRVLLGSAIATPTELTLSGTLLRVSDGHVVANGSVAGAPDSVAVLVNRLTARLLSLEAGEGHERLDGLAATSLEALQDYLAGQRAYRRGDYFAAMDLYGSALKRDSTFVQAAFGLLTTNPHVGTVSRTEGLLAIPTVWRLRERLSARDVALLRGMTFVGPNYPHPSTYAEIIAQEENAVAAAPDSPEQWLQLGEALAAYGAVSSIPGWRARAADALDRAIALDSSFTPAVQARLFLSTWERDTTTTRRLAALMEAPVRLGFADGSMAWAAAVTLGDSAGARRWLEQGRDSAEANASQQLVKVALHSVQVGFPLADARWANLTLRQHGATEKARSSAWLGEQAVAFAEGRLVPAEQMAPGGGAWNTFNLVEQAVVEPPYRPLAEAVVARNDPAIHLFETRQSTVVWPPVRDCFIELFRVTGGDTSTTRQAIRRLREFAALDPPPIPHETWDPTEFRVCPLLLEALLEGGRDRGGASRLDSLDALMRDGPRWLSLGAPSAPTVAANWTIARLREAQGDIPRALAAIRRRESNYYPSYLWTLPAFLREEGRLAALAGDTAGAIRAYDEYLVMRTHPDPPFQPQRDSVIAERAALKRR